MKRSSLCIAIIFVLSITSCAGGPSVSTYKRPNATLSTSNPIAVVPAKFGQPNDLMLPDALATELLMLGFNVVERTVLAQMVNEKGLNLTEILNGEEYFKLGEHVNIQTVVIVNSTIEGVGVANATCRVIDIKTGEMLLSTTYTQPAPNTPIYARHHTLTDTAKAIAETFKSILPR